MNKSSKTNQQLLLEIEELRTRLDVAQQRLQEANERMQAEMTERKQVEEALEERLQFETLLANLSSRFINLPPDEVDREIEDAMRRVCGLLGVDLAALWQASAAAPGILTLTHFYSAQEGLQPPMRGMVLQDYFPWFQQQLLAGRIVAFSSLEELPAEVALDRENCRLFGVKSNLSLPLSVGGAPPVGALGLNTTRAERDWPDALVKRLQLVAQIFPNALARKRAEVEVARARTELLRVERSLRLNELTASLAHELNQPLAAILSNAQAALRFLKSDKPDLNEFQEIIRDIISDDQRAGNVIRSLRSMMKREEVEKTPTILNDILNDVIQIFRSEAIFRNVSIETELGGSLLPVFGDKGQLQQVVLNIFMNGAEAMSRNPPEQRKLILRTQRKDHSLWVTVRDFGPGIDKENLERVFQPFFTTKETGLGMGLAVCSSIIKEHRGRIWAENNPDGGATFFIELPVISDQ